MEGWDVQEGVVEPWMTAATDVGEHGTAVVWKDMRLPEAAPTVKGTDPYTSEIMDLERHLGLVFHRFINGDVGGMAPVKITINAKEVKANDPVGHKLTKEIHDIKVRIPTKTDADAHVRVKVFVLPSVGEVKSLHGEDAEKAKADLDLMGMFGKANESQGLYLYRNDRLIQWGGWHQMWNTSDEKTKLARVTVDFGKDLDERFGVNISKQIVTLPQYVQTGIKKLAETARNESKRKYLKDEKPSTATTTKPVRPIVPTAGGTVTGGNTPTVGKPTPTPVHPAPAKIPVRTVKTEAFVWKVGNAISGGKEIQVSSRETELGELVAALSSDPTAMATLVRFLERLDRAGIQKSLLTPKA